MTQALDNLYKLFHGHERPKLMGFTIIITERRAVKRLTDRRWLVVGKEDDGKDKYGHTPQVESVVYEDIEVLKQHVDTLDLPAVIKAVNGL